MNKYLFVGLLVILVLFVYYWRNPIGKKAIINGHTIKLELAITDKEKAIGLGDRDTLPLESGMLFVYPQKGTYGFWMHGMRFPLDFIWIDGNSIVDLSENIPAPLPGVRPIELAPKVPVDKILEVNAGIIQKLNIKIGDTVLFTN